MTLCTAQNDCQDLRLCIVAKITSAVSDFLRNLQSTAIKKSTIMRIGSVTSIFPNYDSVYSNMKVYSFLMDFHVITDIDKVFRLL